MVTLAAKARIRAAARTSQPGRRCPQALDIFVELLDLANNTTGIAVPRPGTLERRLELSRSTLRRGVALLRTAGLVETTFVHDRRGYRCGVRYRVIREEPGHLSSTDAALTMTPTGTLVPAAYGSRTHQHVRRSQRSSKSSTSSALGAPVPAEPETPETGRDPAEHSPDACQPGAADLDAATFARSPDRRPNSPVARPALSLATFGMLQKTVWDVLQGRKLLDLDPRQLATDVRLTLHARQMKPADGDAIDRAIDHVHQQQQRLDDDTGVRSRRQRDDRSGQSRHRARQMPGPRWVERQPDTLAERFEQWRKMRPGPEREAERASLDALLQGEQPPTNRHLAAP